MIGDYLMWDDFRIIVIIERIDKRRRRCWTHGYFI